MQEVSGSNPFISTKVQENPKKTDFPELFYAVRDSGACIF